MLIIATLQGEYNRVPYADVGLLPVPDHLKDEQVLFLSDIVPTSFHATELAAVKEGDTVGIWGAGPIGLLSAMWCKWKKAKRIIIVDNVPDRLDLARKEFGAETINFAETPDVIGKFQEICPGGPDSVIDATGFRYSKTLASKIQVGRRRNPLVIATYKKASR